MRPTFIRPPAPTYAAHPPRGSGWLFEPKWDGFRFQVVKDGDLVRLFTKSGAEYSDRPPGMVEHLKRLPTRAATLDGELCLIGTDGRPRFLRAIAGDASAPAG